MLLSYTIIHLVEANRNDQLAVSALMEPLVFELTDSAKQAQNISKLLFLKIAAPNLDLVSLNRTAPSCALAHSIEID